MVAFMQVFLVFLVAPMAVYLAILCKVAKTPEIGLGIVVIAGVVSLCVGSITFPPALLTAIGGVSWLVCMMLGVMTPGIYRAFAVGAFLVSFLPLMPMLLESSRVLAEVRAQYPIESLANRLAYEAARETEVEPIPLSPEQQQTLETIETRTRQLSNRQLALETLHTRERLDFEGAFGFGEFRMPVVRTRQQYRRYVEPPESPLVPLPEYQPEESDASLEPLAAEAPQAAPPQVAAQNALIGAEKPMQPALRGIHLSGVFARQPGLDRVARSGSRLRAARHVEMAGR